MAVVVDASLVVVMATADPRATAVEPVFRRWEEEGEELHAPALLPYELASAFVRLMKAGRLDPEEMDSAWSVFESLPIALHPVGDGRIVSDIARQLRRSSAYDAAYLALGKELGGAMWTLDVSLARNAVQLGFPVHAVDVPPATA